ncbi:MAG: response regulator [Anaerolineae bacterium]
MQDQVVFARQVGHALTHLYDPDILRSHPLISTFGLLNHPNARVELREILIRGIEQLKPDPGEPISSRSWRVYKLLQLRYLQQMDQEQTAYQLGVGVRHLRREQKVAIEILADLLAQQHKVVDTPADLSALPSDELIEQELAWLKTSSQENSVNALDILQAAIQLVTPLARAHKVKFTSEPNLKLPAVTLNPVGLRQALVILISSTVKRIPKGQIYYSAVESGKQVSLNIIASVKDKLIAESADTSVELRAARAILNACSLTLESRELENSLFLTIHLPKSEEVKICLIDDNADMAQLFERYLAGTPYRVSSRRNATQLFEWIEEQRPHLIILDVMMPEVDGWEILGILKQHPLTSALPVIICSVLPERDLALMLGAATYLPKPVTQSALLATLNQVWPSGGSTPH